MKKQICLNNDFSTTRRLFKKQSECFLKSDSADPKGKHGGLRSKGYFKKSAADSPLVTVVTVVLNEVEGLEKTIQSVLEQTFNNIEFIIVDGASSNATLDVIKHYNDKIDFWISEPDRGIYDAMNKGIEYASGDWINFMNAGDFFYQQNSVETVFNKEYGDAEFIYGHTFFQGGDFNGVVKAWNFKILWKTMVFTHQSLFARREVLLKHKFNLDYKICADYHMIYNAYMRGQTFFNSDTVIAAFSPGISDFNRARMAFEKWTVVKKHRNDIIFHWFYLRLYIKRYVQDLFKRIKLFLSGKPR